MFVIIICLIIGVEADLNGIYVEAYNNSLLQNKFGGNLHHSLYDIVRGFPAYHLSIVFDNNSDPLFLNHLAEYLLRNSFSLSLHNITELEQQEKYFKHLDDVTNRHTDLHTIYFCTTKMSEHILLELYANNLIRSNLIFMFYWGKKEMYRFFLRNLYQTMKVVVITNPRRDAYRLYYNQATSYKKHHLEMCNWWIEGRGLFRHPTLPKALDIFRDFKGRMIDKPPWHFVQYTNDSLFVHGGRDDKLLRLISEKLNFRYTYFDPPERIQGTSFNVNGTFEGVLGLIWEKEAEFFMGDLALTHERTKVVEFSFLTLADSGAFVTHAPSKLNEALALIRPFNWQVWPAIIVTILLSGPALYLIIALPNAWRPRFLVRDQLRLFFDCSWYTTGIFFKQTMKPPGESHKSRFFTILLILSATYVIGDMYAANLTSMLARPGREKPINNLNQLEEAVVLRGYKLMVEKRSSSYSLLENGTGIYGRLWEIMNTGNDLNTLLVESVESGVKLVRDASNLAVMAGRETLFFDIQRFGPQNFHLSEKLNTAYSAIALQLGCPYIDNFNQVLMAIFEAGILTKMTQDEYENLGKQQMLNAADIESDVDGSLMPGTQSANRKALEESESLEPINIKMLQGAFYLLMIGVALSGLVLVCELTYSRHSTLRKRKERFPRCVLLKRHIYERILRTVRRVRRFFRHAMNDAIIATFDYIESTAGSSPVPNGATHLHRSVYI